MRTLGPSLLLSLILCLGSRLDAQTTDLNTQLMLSTVKLANPDSVGTAFLLNRPDPEGPKASRPVLVTAAHVFSRMRGDEATLFYRTREPDGVYTKTPLQLTVRRNGKDLWTRHPTADVAVMDLPATPVVPIQGISVELLASDADLDRYEVHPGDAIKCVGFPHPNQFEANPSGFGVVRLGCIASFPLLPTRTTKTFLCDLNCFEGDSGGPVYLTDDHRFYGGTAGPGRVQLILGLVSGQHFIDEEFKMIYQSAKFRHRMGMAIIVHANAVREAIEILARVP